MALPKQPTEKGLQVDRHQLKPLLGQKLGQIDQPITGRCELAVTHLGDALPTGSSTYVHSLLRICNGRMGRRWEAIGFWQQAGQGMGIEQKRRIGVVAHRKGSTGPWAAPAAKGESKACLLGLASSFHPRSSESMGREVDTARPSSHRCSGADSSPVRAPESPSSQRAGHAQEVASPLREAGPQYKARALRAARRVRTTADLPNLDVLLAFVREVARTIGADIRIELKILQNSKQVIKLYLWKERRIARLVITKLFGSGKRIAVLGFAFKADTNDMRESPAISICRDLLVGGAMLQIVNPKVSERQMALDLGQERVRAVGTKCPTCSRPPAAPLPCCCSPNGRHSPISTGPQWWGNAAAGLVV